MDVLLDFSSILLKLYLLLISCSNVLNMFMLDNNLLQLNCIGRLPIENE